MRIALLGSTESWYFHDLRRAATGHVLTAVTFRDLASTIATGSVQNESVQIDSGPVSLHTADVVLVRTMPPGSLEQVVFRMDVLGRLAAHGVRVVNSPRAIETAVDKYLSTSLLAAAGLPTPSTVACQTAAAAMEAFERLGGDVVCKPLFGSEGRGIFRLNDPDAAYRAARMLEQQQAVIYWQQFIDHPGFDLRVLVVGDKAFGMRRANPNDWRTNASRGARCEPLEVTAELAALARRAARAVGAEIAGVDLLPNRDGRLHVLEVNAVPGWRALAGTLRLDVAREVIDYLAASMPR
ncbi:MAG: RimK family alpha-L-glutamate ligase [Pirellulales bacterium]